MVNAWMTQNKNTAAKWLLKRVVSTFVFLKLEDMSFKIVAIASIEQQIRLTFNKRTFVFLDLFDRINNKNDVN